MNRISLALLFFLTFSLTALADVPTKKFIELGWDIPNTQYIRDHWQEMEANAPFAGIMYEIRAAAGGTSSQHFMSPADWNREDFQSCIDDMNSCKFQQFTDNFIRINFSPGTVDWDDDAGWERLCKKAAICAWVARETGSKGVAPDFESYGRTLFRNCTEINKGKSYAEMKKLVRTRGEQFCKALASEYPNMTVLSLWLNSINSSAGRSVNPDSLLASSGYGLLPAFVEGMLAAAPAEMVLVDGCETGYYIEGDAFRKQALDMVLWTGACARLVAPELRQKYRSQVQCGFGIYLDMYTNPEGSHYYRGPREDGGSRLDRLCDSLRDSLAASDQYVWVYGEKNRWWNIPENQNPEKPCVHWETALPGLSDQLVQIANPEKVLARIVERVNAGKEGENLITPETKWGFWQDEKSHGTKSQGENLLEIKKCENGCFLFEKEVQPGERFYFEAEIRSTGAALPYANTSWKNKEGWVWSYSANYAPDPNDQAEWKKVNGWVTTPPGICTFVLMLGVHNQADESDECQFRNMKVYQLK